MSQKSPFGKTKDRARREIVRNRYATAKLNMSAFAPADNEMPGGYHYPGVTKYSQRSLNGIGGFADFSQVFDSYVKYGDNKKNWQQIIREYGSATTKMSIDDWKIDANDIQAYSCTFENGPGTKWVGSVIGGSILPTEYNTNNVLPRASFYSESSLDKYDQHALNEFLVRASTESALQGAVFLGELKKSKQLLVNGFRDVLKVCKDYKQACIDIQGFGYPVKELRRLLANKYLEFEFGWKPLVQDVNAAYKELTRVSSHPPVKRITSYVSDLDQSSDRRSRRAGKSHMAVPERDFTRWPITYEHQYDVADFVSMYALGRSVRVRNREHGYHFAKYVGAVRPYVSSDLGSFSSRLGLQPTDLLSYAWEIAPYSFLSDYLLPIGDLLAIDWDVNSKLHWTMRLRGFVAVGLCDIEPLRDPLYEGFLSDVPITRKFRTKIQRTRIERDDRSDFNLRGGLILKVPGDKQVMNAIALILR